THPRIPRPGQAAGRTWWELPAAPARRHPHPGSSPGQALGTPSGLARLSAAALIVAMGELSPWRSVLPPRSRRRRAFGTGGGEEVRLIPLTQLRLRGDDVELVATRVGAYARRYDCPLAIPARAD